MMKEFDSTTRDINKKGKESGSVIRLGHLISLLWVQVRCEIKLVGV